MRLGSLELEPLAPAAAVRWILARAAERQPCVIVTSNIQHLQVAETDAAFRRVVQRAELNVADGWPIVAASWILPGARLPGRVAGIDLVDRVLREGNDLRLAILGGPPGAAAALAAREEARHSIVVVDELPPGTWESDDGIGALSAKLAAAEPTLTLVGIAAPRRELLADALRPALRGPAICCGAAVEVLAGTRPRAPRLVQAVGLEWAFRMALEPRRLLPRYVRAGVVFLRVVARELAAGRHRRGDVNS